MKSTIRFPRCSRAGGTLLLATFAAWGLLAKVTVTLSLPPGSPAPGVPFQLSGSVQGTEAPMLPTWSVLEEAFEGALASLSWAVVALAAAMALAATGTWR